MSIWSIDIIIIVYIIYFIIINRKQLYHLIKTIQLYPDCPFQPNHPVLSRSVQRFLHYPNCSPLHHLSLSTSPIQLFYTRSTLFNPFHSTPPIPLYYTNLILPHPFRSTPPLTHPTLLHQYQTTPSIVQIIKNRNRNKNKNKNILVNYIYSIFYYIGMV